MNVSEILDEVQWDSHRCCRHCGRQGDQCESWCVFRATRAKHAPEGPDGPKLPEWVTALGLEWDGRPEGRYDDALVLDANGNSIWMFPHTNTYSGYIGWPLRPKSPRDATPVPPPGQYQCSPTLVAICVYCGLETKASEYDNTKPCVRCGGADRRSGNDRRKAFATIAGEKHVG